jgi:predicted transcriptional regulator of viral defense system
MQEKLKELLAIRDGNLSMKEARKLGIAATTVQRLVNQGKLIKVDRGYYVEDGHGIDDLFFGFSNVFQGIFSHETTLDIYQLSTNMPKFIHLTFPHGYNVDRSITKEQQLQFHFVKKQEVYELGKVEGTPFQGNPITMYDKERTLCDIWNPRYEIEYEMKLEALKEYMEDPLRDPSKLRDYMTKLHVEKEMKYHMQSLY